MLTLELYTPADDDRPIFLTGSFNAWKTADPVFRMEKMKPGHYRYVFKEAAPVSTAIEYKYVKGGWDGEELNNDGHPPSNRRMEVAKGKVLDMVPRWKSHGAGYDPSFYPDIRIVAKRFNLPQLQRRRRISVLLPWNYEQSDRRYPVLYLQDGQNLFEDNAPFGTWGVDKKLAMLAQAGKGDFIVVAIDHGGQARIQEYSPYDTPKWGEGLGQEYTRFLAETLKPHIDKHFRTLPEREYTGIGGSSMGGLISIYAGLMFPNLFSRFMVFSPSLWASPKLFFEPIQFSAFSETRIYLYGGGKEGSGMLTNLQRFKAAVEKSGMDAKRIQIRLEVDPNGQHNEARWGNEFPKAAAWLFE